MALQVIESFDQFTVLVFELSCLFDDKLNHQSQVVLQHKFESILGNNPVNL